MLRLTELLGRRVIDSRGEALGKLRDLAARMEHPYPSVTAISVRSGWRRGATWRWQDVTELEPAIQLGASSERLVDFSLASDELWLAEHVLDTQVIDIRGRCLVRAGDVALSADDGVLRLVGVEIGRAAVLRRLGLRRLARRTESQLVDWRELHLASGRGHALQLLQLSTPAARVHSLSSDELEVVISRLPAHRAAEVLRAIRAPGAESPAKPEDVRRRYLRVLRRRHRAPS